MASLRATLQGDMDEQWFRSRIAEKYGTIENFAKRIKGLSGATLAQSAVSRTLTGERALGVCEIRQYAKHLDVPVVEILIRAGIVTEREVELWMHARE